MSEVLLYDILTQHSQLFNITRQWFIVFVVVDNNGSLQGPLREEGRQKGLVNAQSRDSCPRTVFLSHLT